MATGRTHEKDTLFLGAPANHAAKKAAEDGGPGIFLETVRCFWSALKLWRARRSASSC